MVNANNAAAAIDMSVTENRIVHLPYDAAVMIDLSIEADDQTDTAHGTEFWGTTDTGATWRVHIEAQS